MRTEEKKIEWERLFKEFETFELNAEARRIESLPFVSSLVKPVPEFVKAFIGKKAESHLTHDEAIKALYYFLLEKRYDERLNLLHFAFHIFDDDTHLPDEVIAQTPFPHEEGVPKFRYFNQGDYNIEI